jgi:hypothetical protein
MINQKDKNILDVFDKMFKYIPDSNERKQQIDNGIYDPSIFCDNLLLLSKMQNAIFVNKYV